MNNSNQNPKIIVNNQEEGNRIRVEQWCKSARLCRARDRHVFRDLVGSCNVEGIRGDVTHTNLVVLGLIRAKLMRILQLALYF